MPYLQALEAVPNGVVMIDRAGRIVLVNAELERMFGHPRDAMLDRPIEMLLPERFRAGHEKMRAAYWPHPSKRAMGSGRELFGLRADGTEFPVEIGLNPTDTPDGTMVIASIVDVSDRLAAEAIFRNVVEAAPYGMVMVDAKGKIALVNPRLETLFGYDHEQLIGRPLEILLPERHRARHVGLRQGYQAAPEMRGMAVGRDLMALHRNGTEFPVEIGLSSIPAAVPGKDGAMSLAVVIDISARKQMELELRQANANLEEFTYVASHDLRSPLHGIGDLVEWIVEDLGKNQDSVLHNLDRVRTRVKRMGGVIDDLLAYARAGRTSAEQEMVDPSALIGGILEMQQLPPGFDVAVTVDVAPFTAAKTPLETALRNLIGNAVKHRPRGHIDVSVVEDGSYYRFVVADDGPGIPSSAHDRIFKLFQTLTSTQRDGSGIGLALTKRLVEGHGGRLELASHDGERGSTFSFWWPRFARRETP